MTSSDSGQTADDSGYEGPDVERSMDDVPVTDPGANELDDSADSYVSPANPRNADSEKPAAD